MFTRKEKVSIYAGMNVIVPPLCWGAIDGARMWANLKLAFIIVVFGSVLAFKMNIGVLYYKCSRQIPKNLV